MSKISLPFAFTTLALLLASCCQCPIPSSEIIDRSRGLPRADALYAVVKVFYGTDRKATGSHDPNSFFGAERGDLSYGSCEVSIPRDHRMGQLERPSVLRLEFTEDPSRHVTVISVVPAPADAFFGEVGSRVGRSSDKQVLVFVHGFDNSFADAAQRTAQLSYDLGYDGAPVFYSWPSKGALSVDAYRSDAVDAEWAADHLKAFLLNLQARTGCRHIQVIAHSMGNVTLTKALTEIGQPAMPATDPPRSLDQVKVDELILAAPDIDAQVFRDQIAPAIVTAAKRVTLYVSSRDQALIYSNALHGDKRRAGEAGVPLVVVPLIETVDVTPLSTDLMGHSYFASNTSVLSDLIQLINGKAVDQRPCLDKAQGDGQVYWRFRASCVGQEHDTMLH